MPAPNAINIATEHHDNLITETGNLILVMENSGPGPGSVVVRDGTVAVVSVGVRARTE